MSGAGSGMVEQVSRGGIRVDVSPGELIDKITILELKLERIGDPAKVANVRLEHDVLMEVYAREVVESVALRALTERLKSINAALWEIEDHIREHERAKKFDAEFVTLARSVYRTNDERSAVKRAINELLASKIIEEKSYAAY
jgi:alpha-mannosidase